MTHRKWTVEEKMSVVMEMFQKERPVTQICKSYGINDAQAYKWRDEALAAMQERLSGRKKGKGNGSCQGEVERLLKLVGQQAYAIECQKKIAQGLPL
ncbi:MAG: transposase [Candidatus Margulisbacteria bacterium]|nr:transposase [Candidatus Margulisiibacteriota bacterium]